MGQHFRIRPPFAPVVLVTLLLVGPWVSGQVIQVPTDQPTIQLALIAARSGTVVQVAPGFYPENIVWPPTDGIRLVSTEGPSVTVISGGGLGRVIRFPPGLTRATVLEGFTVTGGKDRFGAGILIESSPTIRGNIIRGNGSDSTNSNEGGGVFVAAGAPRIELNEIRSNRLTAGKYNYGAGIFTLGGTSPEIVANTVADNVCDGALDSRGGGVHADGPALIASNTIVRNEATCPIQSRGGGVYAGPGAQVVGNTVADNICSGGQWAMGGGVAAFPGSSQGVSCVNNVVVRNAVYGPTATGGGVHCSGNPVTVDFNDVWLNVGGDYFGCGPGPNDRSVDPQFAGPGDHHLLAASPLVDAGDSSRVPRTAALDADGDPRRLDGNFDGLPGNGARVDIGADEYTPVRLSLVGSPRVGTTLDFRVSSPPGALALFASATSANLFVNPYGNVLLGFPIGPLGSGPAPGQVLLPVPSLNALAGVSVHVQGFVAFTGSPGLGMLTNRLDLTLANPAILIERFQDRSHEEPGATTAAWTVGNQPGLFATYGYGGNGEEGDLVLTGQKTLDSGTRLPGADGLVEWHFNLLHIGPKASLRLEGPYPIRLNMLGACVIEGLIDASGSVGMNAPAGRASQVGTLAGGAGGPGGGAGGDANTNPNYPLGALPFDLRGGPGYPRVFTQCGDPNRSDNRLITVLEPNCGGGTGGNRGVPTGTLLRSGCSGNGGGHFGDGVQTDYLCSNIGAFGREYGLKWIVPTGPNAVQQPTAGAGGGAGGNAVTSSSNPAPSEDIVAGSGGGAGGGVEVFAVGPLTVKPTARILSLGGNGGIGRSTLVGVVPVQAGFGGGGAGGSIWLTGASVTVESGATISALGGRGNPIPPMPTRTGDGGDGYVIIRDRTGNPTVGSLNITPAPVAGREQHTPQVTGVSYAISRWYSATSINPQWAFDAGNPQTGEVVPGRDLTFLNPPLAGQKVFILWQGAPDLNGKPNPASNAWYPNAYTPDITQLRGRGLRWVRFRITFQTGSAFLPIPQMLAVKEVRIHY